MAKRKILKAEKRKILGRKVKSLRRKGLFPANIYGKNIKSTAIQVDMGEFEKLFAVAGETEVIDLQVNKEKSRRTALIRDIQTDPVTNNPLHADFMQVELTEKVEAPVPIEFINEAPAVKENQGILLELLNELEVEALPTDLPPKIEVDISGLTKVDDAIIVADLKLPKGTIAKTNPNELVCKIEAEKVEETEEAPVVPEAPAAPSEKTATTKGTKGAETEKDEK